MTELLAGGKIMDCFVVGIWNTGDHRYGDYFPENPFQNMLPQEKAIVLELGNRIKYRKFQNEKPNSDNYLNFIVKELKPFIDSHFSTFKDRQHTFIGGSSMGGLISMYAMCEYPKVFGGAACLSIHWAGLFVRKNNPVPPYFLAYLNRKAPAPKTHQFYFDFGTATLDTLYEEHQLKADSILIRTGYGSRSLKTLKFEGENHSETAWRKRLKIPLLFLLGEKTKPEPHRSK
jgi:enterochelin esterase-like enzyme